MKASELIQVLADGIARYGDQPALLRMPGLCPPVVEAMASHNGTLLYAEECDEASAYRNRIADLETELEEIRAELRSPCSDTIPAPAPEVAA